MRLSDIYWKQDADLARIEADLLLEAERQQIIVWDDEDEEDDDEADE